ncbi:hypothetical protein C8R43DRAFT_1152109 [Mycena crocata]|nr:hypothetical protein C8R43DRAFT_1152109 [Mycena crocata]
MWSPSKEGRKIKTAVVPVSFNVYARVIFPEDDSRVTYPYLPLSSFMPRGPHEAISHDVLVFPADGSEPRITSMSFNEAGSKANPYGFYKVNVDLRGVYGMHNMYATRQKSWHIINQPEKVTEGDYDLFHNMSRKLPINATMARLVGVDPQKPGKRSLWRGDVVVVKMANSVVKNGGHKDYLDVPSQVIELFATRLVPLWYISDEWRDFLQHEQDFNDITLENEQTWSLYQELYPTWGDSRSGFDKKNYETKQIKRQELQSIIACGLCKAKESSTGPLRVCGGCRNEKYCSPGCQRLAWQEHKSESILDLCHLLEEAPPITAIRTLANCNGFEFNSTSN